MEVDPAPVQAEAVEELSQLLAQLEETPQHVPHLLKAIDLMASLRLASDQVDLVDRLSELVMLSESRWQAYFDILLNATIDLDALAEVLERFDRAEQDYASPSLLLRHVQFLRDHQSAFPDILTTDKLRGMIQAVVNSSAGLLDQSHTVWQSWLEWELEQDLDVEKIHQMFKDRLGVPHTAIQSTFDAYSTFCSQHAPNDYEARLVAATQASQPAKQILAERRFGKTRQELEDALVATEDKTAVYNEYIRWETDKSAKKPNAALTRAIFERAVAWAAVTSNPVEPEFWGKYISWAGDNLVLQRAVRACPESATLWGHYFIEMEPEEVFETPLAMGSVDPVDIYIHWASYLSRTNQSILDIISRGLEHPDPGCKLEKFALEWAETRAPEHLDQVLALVDKPNKARSSSYQMTLLRSGIETRRGNIHKAREVLMAAIQRSDLDWPEMIYEAISRFEAIHGDTKSIKESRRSIERESEKLARRRQKAAEEYAYVAAPAEAPVVQVPAEPEKPLERDREHTTIVISGIADVTSARLEAFFEDCGAIREITIIGSSALVEFKKVESVPMALNRDRKKLDNHDVRVSMMWRSTLYITNFAPDADDASIRTTFSRFGEILQTRWPSKKYKEDRRFCFVTMDSPAAAQNALSLDGTSAGEFPLKVAIADPAAKAKRTDANTSLFVGGLTPQTTEADLREQFEKFGTIRFIKLVRDFATNEFKGIAFVHMSSEAEATAAIALHGAHLNGKLLNVKLSDPNHKKKTVDKRATIRLHGLPDQTQEGLLQQALEKIVPVKRLEVFAKQHEAVAELVNAADAGKLLLGNKPFVFNGATITFSESGKRPESALAFAPRNARKGKMGKGRQAPVDKALATLATGDRGQDDFRAIVDAKNNQRKGNLEALQEERPAKRLKTTSE